MSKTANKTTRVLMLRILMRAIMSSGNEGASRPCDSSMAVGVYPGKRRRGICIRARHPRDERPIAPRSPNRTEENRTSGQSLRESAFFPPQRTPCLEKRREEKRREEKCGIVETQWPAPPTGQAKSTRRRYTHRLRDRRTWVILR